MLLENGDILVPAEDGSQMVKLRPGDEGHAEWLAHLQERSRQERGRQERGRPERTRQGPSYREARRPSVGRTAARFGIGLIVFILVVVILLVVAALVILSLVSDLSLPDLPGLPEELRDLPEDAPKGPENAPG
jgi:hypothetical protein